MRPQEGAAGSGKSFWLLETDRWMMAIDRKQLFQVVLLVVLLAVGGGLYLMQQDGGLDLFALLSGEEPTPTPPPPPVRKAPPPEPAAVPAAPKPAPAAAAPAPGPVSEPIPLTPVKGELAGRPFIPESAVFEEGVLHLRQGQDRELRIVLPGTSWVTPAGRRFEVSGRVGEKDPHVYLATKAEGQWQLTPLAEGLELRLEFGPETQRKLPGKLRLVYGDNAKQTVAGAFTAEVHGFRIVDGQPDLAADSLGTLEYLALRELLKDDPDKPVKVLAMRHGRLETGAKGKPSGSLEIEYRVGESGKPVVERYQFVKEAGTWQVTRVTKVGK